MYYVIQEKLFKEENYENLIETLERFNLDYEVVKLTANDNTIHINTDRVDIFPFGAVRMAKIAKDYNWNPGSSMCDNHDFEIYGNRYGEHMLNSDSLIMKVKDIKYLGPFFIRPTKDTKAFTGKIIHNYVEWIDFLLVIEKHPDRLLTLDTVVQVASVKKILNEIRFWIVKGKIVTASMYNMGNNYFLSNIIDEDAYEFVNQMIQIFEINDTFVMDICLTPGGYKIVECNCTNSAGFYKADMNKLIMSLEDAFGSYELR